MQQTDVEIAGGAGGSIRRRFPHLPGGGLKWWARLAVTGRAYFREVAIGFPLRDVLFGLRYGFAADRVFLYGRDAIRSGRYLTDLQRQFSRFINPKPARELLEDKLLFEALANKFVQVPKNYLYCDNMRLVVLSEDWEQIATSPQTHRFVWKRARGGGGTYVKFVTLQGGTVTVDDKKTTLAEFYRLFTGVDESLLCEFVEQSEFCRHIYPNTTNSLRVICMRDAARAAFIARAVLRLGTRKSKGVDNFGQGGLSVDIDLDHGVLGEAVEHHAEAPRSPARYQAHPDTGAQIAQQRIPMWNLVRDQSLLLMRTMPFINYVGWDIVLTEKGPVFLEGNNYTGVRLVQAHAGLLQDGRVREFYKRFGII
jgi:hypothetical protein